MGCDDRTGCGEGLLIGKPGGQSCLQNLMMCLRVAQPSWVWLRSSPPRPYPLPAYQFKRLNSSVLQGGTSIEDLAEKFPDKIVKIPIDIREGITDAQAMQVRGAGGYGAGVLSWRGVNFPTGWMSL